MGNAKGKVMITRVDEKSVFTPTVLSVAPMMEWTDRHCRYFHRQISNTVELYTEMVTSAALVRGGALDLLEFDRTEHPVVLQLGGSDPRELAQAARMGAQHGYDEINLNVGCPSDRVQSGAFGAVLMYEPGLVARCVTAMQEGVGVPVTVKCRIGVDDQNPADVLPQFLETLVGCGTTKVIIHARKAILKGLSPKQNRTVPPLDYPLVHRMRQEFPSLNLGINGGIETLEAAQRFWKAGFDGVMIGRAAYHRPWQVLSDLDQHITGEPSKVTVDRVIDEMAQYADRHIAQGGRLHQVSRHMLGLFAGHTGARLWRQRLSTLAQEAGATGDTLRRAFDEVMKVQMQRAAS